jgi:Domain of unknown function (DUF4402)
MSLAQAHSGAARHVTAGLLRDVGLCAIIAFTPAVVFGATSNVPVTASILPPIALSEPAEMRFGSIAPSGTAGNVTLVLPAALSATQPTTAAPTIVGTRTRTGGITLLGGGTCSATVICGAGSVLVSGPLSGTFSTVTLPASVTLTSGANTMIVNALQTRYGPPGTAGVTAGAASFSATGTATVLLTGQLVVGATQAAGNYSGTLVITVDY